MNLLSSFAPHPPPASKNHPITHGDGQVIDTSLSGGFRIGRGALFATGEYRNRYETNRADADPRDQIVPGDANNNAVAQPNHHWGDSYARDVMLFTNLNLPLTEDGKQVLYAFGGYSNRHGSHQRGLGGWGRLDVSAAYSNNETEIVGEVATPSQLAGLSEVLFDRIERRRIECGQPKDSLRLMQSWKRGAVGLTARESRYGEFCSFTLLPIDDQIYDAKWLADFEVGYDRRNYTMTVGVENVFDQFPDRNRLGTPQANFGIVTYPSQSPFGMNGRFVYSRITVTF